ncbi:MAG: VWA domain-containing protein [Muribaculaceae bacterium]|nr:VWA domain-containing protein [Muribaculaceae bacterium]
MKTEIKNDSVIYNVIILDKSGSMDSIRTLAVGGVNETLGTIRAQQKANPDTTQLVTIVAFCSCEMKKIVDSKPIGQVKNLSLDDYQPCCCTPLYDAVGTTIVKTHRLVEGVKSASVSVTIITDGYENDSHEFDFTAVSRLIAQYKKEGWLFAYIGADHDVEAVAYSLHIDNALRFDKTEAGTHEMFVRERNSRQAWSAKMADIMRRKKAGLLSEEEELNEKINSNSCYFQ